MKGDNILLVAPTGSGKTEAVLLPIFSKLFQRKHEEGIATIYITPLRALNRDLLKRLLFWDSKLDIPIEVRHGDTESRQRRKQAVSPPKVLVTTPETLQAILPGARMRQHLAHVRHVVIDEVHELASSKRGIQLTVALERLLEITGKEFQRIGLSATIANKEEVAMLIAGVDRRIRVIESSTLKEFGYLVEAPRPNDDDYDLASDLRTSPEAAARIRRMTELVDSHRSTLIFVNSRQNAEMLGHKMNQLGRSDIAVHHGSLSKEERARIEDEFKIGVIKGIICTSTLELGIDIGNVDLVIQYLSPRQVSSLIQRVGRSGHRLDRTSRGIIITAFPDDTLESLAAVKDASQGRLEPTQIHENALDVLAHQIAGILLDKGKVSLDRLSEILRRTYPFRKLSSEKLSGVIDYLAWLREVRIGEEGKALMKTTKTRRYYYENLSMIPDERRYPIIDLISDRRIGTLGDEFMALRVRPGLNFICKGKVWRIVQIEDETGTVYVVPSEDPMAAIPGWDGEMLPVPFDLAQETGRLRQRIREHLDQSLAATETMTKLTGEFSVDEATIAEAVGEVNEQVTTGFPLPTHNHILLEIFGKYMIAHVCFGEIVNYTLGCILDAVLSERELITGWWNDGYRILIETPREVTALETRSMKTALFNLTPKEVAGYFNDYLAARFPFAYKMKSVAERFGALPRGKTILDSNRLRQLIGQFKDTPIFDETLREVTLEKVDIKKVTEIMKEIRGGHIRIDAVYDFKSPSPLARHILVKYADLSELMAPERVLQSNIEKMKRTIEARKVTGLCLSCGQLTDTVRIRELPEHPMCSRCNTALLALIRPRQDAATLQEILKKRMNKQKVSEEELKELAYARHTADLALSYGRKAFAALQVRGVGPETASRILARMHQEEDDLYMDLLKAKIQYLRTREYWDKKENRPAFNGRT